MDNPQILEKLGFELSGIEALDWIVMIAGVILLFYLCDLLCHKLIIPIVRKFTAKTVNRWDDMLLDKANIKALCRLIPGIVLSLALPYLLEEKSTVYILCLKLCNVYIAVIGVNLLCNIFSSLYKISNESEKTKDHTLQGVFQMLKIVAIGVGIIIIVSILFDKNPSKLLAGLGASAAMLMLVFKDSIMGLVAGVKLSANDMLRPGDWITMPKYEADGFVIDVTLTTVKVQNWDKTITTIPPYALVSDSFQNWRGMFCSGGRRIKRSILIDANSIQFCEGKMREDFIKKGFINAGEERRVANLTLFREWLEKWLHDHPAVHKEMIILVRQLQPTQLGVPLELYFFSSDTGWIVYEHLQAEIFEYLYALLPEFGLRAFQSPAGTDIAKLNIN